MPGLVVSNGVVLQTRFCSHIAGLIAWMGCSFCEEAQRDLENNMISTKSQTEKDDATRGSKA